MDKGLARTEQGLGKDCARIGVLGNIWMFWWCFDEFGGING